MWFPRESHSDACTGNPCHYLWQTPDLSQRKASICWRPSKRYSHPPSRAGPNVQCYVSGWKERPTCLSLLQQEKKVGKYRREIRRNGACLIFRRKPSGFCPLRTDQKQSKRKGGWLVGGSSIWASIEKKKKKKWKEWKSESRFHHVWYWMEGNHQPSWKDRIRHWNKLISCKENPTSNGHYTLRHQEIKRI